MHHETQTGPGESVRSTPSADVMKHLALEARRTHPTLPIDWLFGVTVRVVGGGGGSLLYSSTAFHSVD